MVWRSLKWTVSGLIVFILVFISWPKYELFQCRSKQSEAKAWLSHLYQAEKFYYAHHQHYVSLETLIEQSLVKSNDLNYTYKTVFANGHAFELQAIAKNLDEDTWTVNQSGKLVARFDACSVR
ncbi:MAG: hypothetical protein I8H75_06010 [Myxococcaceae bacterium]|nr:hypothetical protein [Myxococcaceae bacterium]MBH2006870.1 hypothetical protein [Myxococcaceae bacterium]